MNLILVVLQALQVAFLGLHDWIPLGGLNNLAAIRAADPFDKRLRVTLLSTLPYAIGLAASLIDATERYPVWLMDWLWVSYLLLFVGQLRAWWVPYLWREQPARAQRYQTMFADTHAFLPERRGIRPNTLHLLLHATTLATLIVLWLE